MALTVDNLKIFCDVVKLKSFSRGAEVNQVTQSAASQAISHIEKRLGVHLIDRSRRPLDLTEEGKDFFDKCRTIVDDYFALESRIRQRHEKSAANIRVASIYSVALYGMNRYIRKFQESYPKGNVQIQYLHPEKVYQNILGSEADLGLVSFPRPLKEIRVIPWRDELMVMVCSPAHRLADRQKIAVGELDGEEFVAFDSWLAIRSNVDSFLEENRTRVKITLEFDNIEAIKRAVEIGEGVSILPEPTVQSEVKNGTLVAIAFENAEFYRPCV